MSRTYISHSDEELGSAKPPQSIGTNPRLSGDSTWITARNSITSAKIDGQVEKARTELSDYLRLHSGWDGYDGRTFEESTIKAAKKQLETIRSFFKEEDILPNEITPGPLNDGSVDLEVSYDRKCLFLTFHPDKKEVTIYKEGPDDTIDEREVLLEERVMEAQLIWLVT